MHSKHIAANIASKVAATVCTVNIAYPQEHQKRWVIWLISQLSYLTLYLTISYLTLPSLILSYLIHN